MNTGCIYNIDLTTNNKDKYSISSDCFNHFYVANINEKGDEINYCTTDNINSLFANFFMIKIINNDCIKNTISELTHNKNIIKVGISFTNGKYQEFDLAKRRIAYNGNIINKYEKLFTDEEDNLCIIISDKNIKYYKELFE